MTTADAAVFKQIKDRLNVPFGHVTLLINGHRVRYANTLSRRRLVIMTYVDDWFRGSWYEADKDGHPVHPEGRFLRPRTRKAYSAKFINAWRKVDRKAAAAMDKVVYHWRDPIWPTPESLVRYLKKNFCNVLLIDTPDGNVDVTNMEVVTDGNG